MSEERTLVLVKPDGVLHGHVGDVITRFEHRSYKLVALKMVQATSDQLRQHYAQLVDKPYFPRIEKFMTSGIMVAMIVEGTNVIEGVRKISGATVPTEAAAGTIRGDYGREWQDGVIRNVVHSSDSVDSAEREIKIWFPEV
ncbi:nucleoside-diphosphate kinase [Lacticaseibacillus brantae]|uniref:Nucleoside diphosphate kinase n=1 Tax=Lacticaseibacillus brantae DSM 23927 TaxID=1423727 RepID=A0A0R2B9A1_9LACO|nr:nucleoside-diphosphate kinase [Lacticaseibacillus brantae]KRM72163.1 nucleoside diphosphate kinase [Lacticaseibacillus brantae DSM 23927]